MSTVVEFPEKRDDLGQGVFPKRSEDTGEAKSGEGSSTRGVVITPYCEICDGNVGHDTWDCPDKSRGIGLGCCICYGPCKKQNDPDYDPVEHQCIEMVKQCVECGYMGHHWAEECPCLIERPDDGSYSTPSHFVPF